jgi:hypothetical protein
MPRLRPLLLSLALLSCGDDLDRPSELRSLRVLAVQADTPFAAPGSRPSLTMALVDAAPGATQGGSPRRVRVAWLGGCDNPPDDAPGACPGALHAAASRLSDADLAAENVPPDAAGTVGFGTTFQATIPQGIIEAHPPSPGALVPYGISIVHFIACGGDLRRAPGERFPLRCVDPSTGQPLGPEDSMTGYFPLWVFRDLTNRNPVVEPGKMLMEEASGRACQGDEGCPAGEGCGAAGRCLRVAARCEEDGGDGCPAIPVGPRIGAESVEVGETATQAGEGVPLENLWVAYFAQHGRMEADARFAHDGDLGWRDHRTVWRAPRAPGEVRLWAVVRDNRGGVSWAFEDVLVR